MPMVEFAINSSISSSTGFAPFELNYGYMPENNCDSGAYTQCSLRKYEQNNDILFPRRDAHMFYDVGMTDEEEWLVDEITAH
ncbi:hypothetical protein PISMIDRAFT_12178 [Pisolithus microcarpus 441]|uniref:Uncharacterized protein n=1 Tax=Pisolithus microcarpus 441 TaxID=765257 RepID=A0A0C9ZGF0_9AGAM|nr:hypothetical protein PISMIDRAFT_12178 [Pisolithus microcarpus 441]